MGIQDLSLGIVVIFILLTVSRIKLSFMSVLNVNLFMVYAMLMITWTFVAAHKNCSHNSPQLYVM